VTSFDRAMKWLLRKDVEAGWYDGSHPRDRHPTLDGVTQETYDRYRKALKPRSHTRSVKMMDSTERDSIYRILYWTKGRCDDIAQKSEALAILHFDACVNHGVASPNNDLSAGAVELLQRALGVEDDGIFGPITWQNLVSELMEDGEVPLATRYLKVREAQYRHLAKKAPNTLGLNLEGWLKRLERLRDQLALP
jgi:lysozyme family protein